MGARVNSGDKKVTIGVKAVKSNQSYKAAGSRLKPGR